MFGLLVFVSFVLCWGWAFVSIKRGYIVMRMPDGERIHYDKVESRRGYLVSLGFFFALPVFNLMMYLMDAAK